MHTRTGIFLIGIQRVIEYQSPNYYQCDIEYHRPYMVNFMTRFVGRIKKKVM